MGLAASSQAILSSFVPRGRRSLWFTVMSAVMIVTILFGLWRLSVVCPDGGFCREMTKLQPDLPATKPKTHVDESHPSPAVESEVPSVSHHSGKEETKPVDHEDSVSTPEPSSSSNPPAVAALDSICQGFPDTSNILLVMKTGASESFGKVPTQILTNLRCVSDFLIFGDMEQTVAGYQIQDSLDEVSDEAKKDNSDFDLYDRQQQCVIDQETCNKKSGADTAAQGWALDKYKNIHIAEKVWRQKPGFDWYLYTDADTYVIWANMVEWLKRLDPKEQLYIGSVAYLGNFPFAHGGSGYLVSQGMMKAFFDGKENVAAAWDKEAKKTCCGDFLFSYALKNKTGVAVKDVRPVINGEKPNTIPFGEDQWCKPIVTMHHIGSQEVTDFHTFEIDRNFSSPMRFKDIYHHFIDPILEEKKKNWDNMSDDVYFLDEGTREYADWQVSKKKQGILEGPEKEAHLSFEHCQHACYEDDRCMQFSYGKGICAMSRTVKHGGPKKPEKNDDDRLVSGWDLKKIKTWVREHDDCGDIEWPSVRA